MTVTGNLNTSTARGDAYRFYIFKQSPINEKVVTGNSLWYMHIDSNTIVATIIEVTANGWT